MYIHKRSRCARQEKFVIAVHTPEKLLIHISEISNPKTNFIVVNDIYTHSMGFAVESCLCAFASKLKLEHEK